MGNDHRRIEGLIAPGTWNINPSASPEEILSTLISASAELYMRSGLQDTASAMNISPYNVLVVASLVQREAKPQDFAKVARVIYNRLAEHRKLEFDSTVNYPLDRREVATTDADRGTDHAVEHLRCRRIARHADLFARHRRAARPPNIPRPAIGCTS